MEIWRDIKNYEGLYQVSNLGRVRSFPRYGTSNNVHYLATKMYGKSRYVRVVLSKNNIQQSFNVHRLVAEAFIPNPNNFPCVNHKSEIRTDNSVENLEWCSVVYNNTFGTARERASKNCKKPIIGFDGTHKLGTYFPSTTDAASFLKVSKSHICTSLKNGKKAVGYFWEYV